MGKELLRSLYIELGEFPTLARKKEIASLVGIESKKVDEIKKAVAEKLRDIRYNSMSFDDDDFSDFHHLFKDGIPSTERYLFPILKNESHAFVIFLINRYKTVLEKNNLIKYVGVANSRSFRFSAYERYIMSLYNALTKFDNENNPNSENERLMKAKNLSLLTEKFRELLSDFKVFYLGVVKERAIGIYENNKNSISRLFCEYESLKEKHEEKEFNNYREKYNDYKKVKVAYDKYSKVKAFLKKYESIESYIDYELKEGERDFENNLRAIAEQICEFNIDVSKVTVSNVGLDPKIFEMIVSDGTTKLYCRSIFTYGAVLVRPHFRFIITKR